MMRAKPVGWPDLHGFGVVREGDEGRRVEHDEHEERTRGKREDVMNMMNTKNERGKTQDTNAHQHVSGYVPRAQSTHPIESPTREKTRR